eukprot:m.18594 g.18594  ORF g.18594 m.18594 type:complete len:65 (+) comp27691_c0_seq1:73-267(+)
MGEPSPTKRSRRQRGKSVTHSYHTDIREVQETQKNLQKLLDDARAGKLKAFRMQPQDFSSIGIK